MTAASMARRVAWLAGCMLCNTVACAAEPASFSFDLVPREVSIVVGEPVVLEGRITNHSPKSAQVAPLFDPAYGLASYVIKRRDREPERFQPYVIYDAVPLTHPLAPGDVLRGSVPISCGAEGYVFKDPGLYMISGSFQDIQAVPVTVSVRAPAPGAEAQQAAVMSQADACHFLLMQAPRSFEDAAKEVQRAFNQPAHGALWRAAGLVLMEDSEGREDLGSCAARLDDPQRALDLAGQIGAGPPLTGQLRLRFLERAISASVAANQPEAGRAYYNQLVSEFQRDNRAQYIITHSFGLLHLADPFIVLKAIPITVTVAGAALPAACSAESVEMAPRTGRVRVKRSLAAAITSLRAEVSGVHEVDRQTGLAAGRATVVAPIQASGHEPQEVEVQLRLRGTIDKQVSGRVEIDRSALPQGLEIEPAALRVNFKLRVPCYRQSFDLPLDRIRLRPTGAYSVGSRVGVELAVPPDLQELIIGADIEGSSQVRIHRH